ncbi:isoprenylcysteine carboxyl methyltransferase [Microbulbifer thermotolerans]|uniref:isoprenylcysteine carboxylmethyltransferase family protein n=1 Tax=Microbulbifer thermotolerans TaxID=252514 RepID=UPI00224A750A|nr:isoprenylcysteine carboxylmethyltransferase family protein [Microbulbifer thermotolerans]MCX2781499.1 isoprenylcysteine carboxyl methyltransferase [Microbulbifer thermotolerans]WKT59579.1 isoprenylcysteine carboxylmethyltransferase family protein [Microbulbifer thermotolerans]
MKKNKKPAAAEAVECPKSPTSVVINLIALGISLLAVVWLREYGQQLPSRTAGLIVVCTALAVPIILLEWLFLKPYRNASAGLDFSRRKQGSARRAAVKLLGFYASVGLVAFVYWLFPEYHGSFYDNYFAVVKTVLPWWLLLAVPYFYWLDGHMLKPRDGYWHLGSWLLGRRDDVDGRAIGQLLLGWLVKLFFLPLMFVYLGNNLTTLLNFDFSQLVGSFRAVFDFTFNFLYYIDLLFVTVGYVCTLRLFDSHIRTAEPSFLGWGVALIGYQPFWGSFSGLYLKYDEGPAWGYWFWNTPWAYSLWGSAILLLIAIYVWASVPFGIRFSNLTHRGILTNGPYRYTKHPAYVSKNLSWWMISMPFMVSTTADEALRHSLLLLLVNFIYFMRARTEERHLSWDPDYVAYARYIEQRGLFAFVGRWFPLLRFKPGCLLNIGGQPRAQGQVHPAAPELATK